MIESTHTIFTIISDVCKILNGDEFFRVSENYKNPIFNRASFDTVNDILGFPWNFSPEPDSSNLNLCDFWILF